MANGSLHFTPGLPGWSFWGKISEIWSQITFAGPKTFVGPLALFQDRFDPLQELGLTTLVSFGETIFFTFLNALLQRFSPYSYILKVFNFKFL